MTLVRDVDVQVPLDTLGVPKLEGAPLIAFLKAMEFTTITRRVGEICGARRQCGRARRAFRRPGRLARAQRRDDRAGRRAARGCARSRPPPRPLAPAAPAAAPTGERTPKSLAAERAARAREEKIDVSAYATVASAAELERWIARAFEAGLVAFDTETTSLDPLQADLVGVSLAVAPGEACYIPIGHRAGAADLFGGGGLLPGQIDEAQAIALLKPLLEDPGVMKIGQNVKFDWHVFARRGVEVAPFDDTMLISYALDSGATNDGHGMDALAERWLGHKTIAFRRGRGLGAQFHRLRAGGDRQGDAIRRRGRRRDAAAVARLEAAPAPPRA